MTPSQSFRSGGPGGGEGVPPCGDSEKWLPVTERPEFYEVSSLGRVRTIASGRILATRQSPDGYIRVNLQINGHRKTLSVHRVVATAFVDNPSARPEVNHLNFNRADNRAENLAWVTPAENSQFSVAAGRPRGTPRKVDWSEVQRLSLVENLSVRDIAKRFGISKSQAHRICCRGGR